jgi:hypothetical protein
VHLIAAANRDQVQRVPSSTVPSAPDQDALLATLAIR